MDIGTLIIVMVIISIAIYIYYRSSVLNYAKLHKKDLILRVRTKSNSTYFFILMISLFLYFLITGVLYNKVTYTTFTFPLMLIPEYIILAICDSNLFIFKDRLAPSNSTKLFNKINGIEIKDTKNQKYCEFLIKQGNSTYVEKVLSKDKEALISALKPLLGEGIEFIY